MVMIEEYPLTNPNHNGVGDTQDTLNIGLAANITRLALTTVSHLAGFIL